MAFYRCVQGSLRCFGVPGGPVRFKLVSLANPGAPRLVRSVGDELSSKTNVLAKSASALSRAKSRVYELGLCNPWEWFCTFTLDATKYDRFDLPRWRRDFSQWLRNQRRLHGGSYSYLLIPERHKDGAWHLHGLMAGIPADELVPFERGKHPEKLVRGGYLNWPRCMEKFGFVSLGHIRSVRAVSSYILKYIGKGLSARTEDFGDHLYFASRGLRGAQLLGRGSFAVPARRPPDFSGEWCSVWWFDREEDFVFVSAEPGRGLPLMCAANEVGNDQLRL